MAITSINSVSNHSKKIHRPYLESDEKLTTEQYQKANKPEGHLVNDRLSSMPKFFFKDLAYDMKAVRDGLKGQANDHQLGRVNDVGLKLGGISIATMLAARTSNPMARVMEYFGLGAFLASMDLFPKLAIQLPSRRLHGFDSGLEYIDDQGRKKSVFQDSNYIPFDMYDGSTPAEDLDIIGDRLGIPRDIKNRNDLIKEQMRKIATQNNTLWMLTAGVATPVMTALICSSLEKPLSDGLKILRNLDYNHLINVSLKNTRDNMPLDVNNIPNNRLSKKVSVLLSEFQNKEMSLADYNKLIDTLSEGLNDKVSKGIKADVDKLMKTSKNNEVSYYINENTVDNILNSIRNNIPVNKKSELEPIFNLQKTEIIEILKGFQKEQLTQNDIVELKKILKGRFAEKIKQHKNPTFCEAIQNRILDGISKEIHANESKFLTKEVSEQIINLAKILGDFKINDKTLEKCIRFKVEYANETILAKSYAKFEKTLFDVLNIKYKEMKEIRQSEEIASKIIDKKIKELVANPEKYQKAIEKLAKAMQSMDKDLNGNQKNAKLLDLINAIENNYNQTAKRLNRLGEFNNVVDMLVKEDVSTLSPSIKNNEELHQLLQGIVPNKYADFAYWGPESNDAARIQYAKHNAKGIGSAKNEVIARIVDRYQGVYNSFNRILHTLDIYNRPDNGVEYTKNILEKSKKVLLEASSAEHAVKLNTVNNPTLYKDLMSYAWNNEGLTDATTKGLSNVNESLLTNFKKYIERFRILIGNYDVDFTKPNHNLNPSDVRRYEKTSATRLNRFNLTAQRPLDFIKNASERQYGSKKWFRIVSVLGASTLAITLLAQLKFGKIKNPQNMQKQVSDDKN